MQEHISPDRSQFPTFPGKWPPCKYKTKKKTYQSTLYKPLWSRGSVELSRGLRPAQHSIIS